VKSSITTSMKIRFYDLNMKYRPNSADEQVLAHSFDNDIFLREIPEYRPAANQTVIDVGAHIGTFTCLLSSKYPQMHIYAIEPCKETFEILRHNVLTNGLRNVTLCPFALSDVSGSGILYHDIRSGNWGHTIVTALSNERENVITTSFTNLIKDYGIETCDLLRMNCEGAEFRILINTPVEILRKVRVMLVLYHSYLESSYSLEQLIKHISIAGFTIRMSHVRETEGWLIACQKPISLRRQARHLFNVVGIELRRRLSGRWDALWGR
jgi:FkbM family methyltransferase